MFLRNRSTETRYILRNIVVVVAVARLEYVTGDRGQHGNQQRQQLPASLHNELLAGEGNSLVGNLAQDGLVFPQLARVTAGQLDVTVQHVQDALAYTVKQVPVAVRNDSFTQFELGCRQHVEGRIIEIYLLHPQSACRRWEMFRWKYVVSKSQEVIRILRKVQNEIPVRSLGRVQVRFV